MNETISPAIPVNLVSMLEAAELLGVSLLRAHSLLREGQLKYAGKFAGAYVLERHAVLELRRQRDLGLLDGRKLRWKR
jgi:hypothetical protein